VKEKEKPRSLLRMGFFILCRERTIKFFKSIWSKCIVGTSAKKFWSDVANKYVAGMLVAGTLFLLGVCLYRTPNVNGSWEFWTTCSEIDQNEKYRGLSLGFRCLMEQSGEEIRGSGEKIYWRDKDGVNGKDEVKKRSKLSFFGHINKHYLWWKNTATIHIEEEGVPPQSNVRTIQSLEMLNDNEMVGDFTTLGWEHSGTVKWTKEKNKK
jgi:hypothetical protein